MSNLPKLAYCIPTYNRSTMVEEFLEQFASLFYQLRINILFYDSSEDNVTELVVKKWKKVYENIDYIHTPSDWHANHKVMYIYEQYAQNHIYDYLWICGDSVRHSEKILKQIVALLDSDYDIIVINGIDKGRIGTREYADGNELFQDCAWHMTLFGSVIVNVHTLLENVPWSYIEEKYEIPERINYSHIGLYFESIYRLDRFKAYYLAADQEVWGSRLKRKTGWYQDAFQVLCEYWPSTMNALPSYYTNKWEAINKLGYYSCLEPWSFLNFRRGNIYNIQTFFRYRKILTGMSRLNTFQRFLVTQKENNPKQFKNHPVVPLCEFKSSYNETGVIIGLNRKNMEEIQPMLTEHGIWEHSFHEYIESVMLTEWKSEGKNL